MNHDIASEWHNKKLKFNRELITLKNPTVLNTPYWIIKQSNDKKNTKKAVIVNPTAELLNVAPEIAGSDIFTMLEKEFNISIIKLQRARQASYYNIDANRWKVEYQRNEKTKFSQITVMESTNREIYIKHDRFPNVPCQKCYRPFHRTAKCDRKFIYEKYKYKIEETKGINQFREFMRTNAKNASSQHNLWSKWLLQRDNLMAVAPTKERPPTKVDSNIKSMDNGEANTAINQKLKNINKQNKYSKESKQLSGNNDKEKVETLKKQKSPWQETSLARNQDKTRIKKLNKSNEQHTFISHNKFAPLFEEDEKKEEI